jgi:hypothetical protein
LFLPVVSSLIIESAQGSCGCTVPTKPGGPVAPRQKLLSVLNMTPVGAFYKKQSLLKSNAVGPETKLLTIKTVIFSSFTSCRAYKKANYFKK